MWSVRIKDFFNVLPFNSSNSVQNFSSLAVSSTSKSRSSAKSFSAFLIVSSVRSLCSSSRVFGFTVCFSRIKLTVSFFRNFLMTFVGHFSCLILLVWLSVSDDCVIHDSWLFSWNSFNGVVPSVSQKLKNLLYI